MLAQCGVVVSAYGNARIILYSFYVLQVMHGTPCHRVCSRYVANRYRLDVGYDIDLAIGIDRPTKTYR